MTSITFNNGFYDFNTNAFNSKTDITSDLSVKYDYKEYKGDEPIFNEIDIYFKKLLKNEDERNRLLKFLSNRIRGIEDNKINFIYGLASNGKSVFIAMIKKLLGDYYQILDVNNVDKIELNIEETHKKRLICIPEFFSNTKILDFLKKLQESINKKDSISPKFQFLIVSNYLPDFSNCEEQDKRRLNVFHFNTTFIRKDKEITKENQEHVDFSYEQKIRNDEWASALMWLLIHKY